MFTATRFANGIIGVSIALIGMWLQLSGLLSMKSIVLFSLWSIFVLCDALLRKKGSRSDIVFTVLWTLFFVYALFGVVTRVSLDTLPEEIGGALIFILTVSLLYGVPLLLNSIHLFLLLTKTKIQEQ